VLTNTHNSKATDKQTKGDDWHNMGNYANRHKEAGVSRRRVLISTQLDRTGRRHVKRYCHHPPPPTTVNRPRSSQREIAQISHQNNQKAFVSSVKGQVEKRIESRVEKHTLSVTIWGRTVFHAASIGIFCQNTRARRKVARLRIAKIIRDGMNDILDRKTALPP